MRKASYSIIIVALAALGAPGCVGPAGDLDDPEQGEADELDGDSPEEETAESEDALGCLLSGVPVGTCTEEWDPYYPTENDAFCGECSYISWKHGYFSVCSGPPVTYEPCDP